MTVICAAGAVMLPFHLNICAIGDHVGQITAHVEESDITISFPRSMTGGSVGKSIYPDGIAWWVVDRIYVEATAPIDAMDGIAADLESVREVLLSSAAIAVRRLLNAYRWRMHQPYVHPVSINPALFQLEVIHVDGTREALPDSVAAFFFNRIPPAPPLDSAITTSSLQRLQQDVLDGIEPPHSDLFSLDLEWLESIGEGNRAVELRERIPVPTD